MKKSSSAAAIRVGRTDGWEGVTAGAQGRAMVRGDLLIIPAPSTNQVRGQLWREDQRLLRNTRQDDGGQGKLYQHLGAVYGPGRRMATGRGSTSASYISTFPFGNGRRRHVKSVCG